MINLAEIQTKVEKTIIYSQNYPFELNCSNLIQKWHQNKSHFIEMFGGETSVTTTNKVSFKLDDNMKETQFTLFVEQLRDFLDEDLFAKDKNDCHFSFIDFLVKNQKTFENKVFASKDSKIKTGDKLLKSFKYFIQDKGKLRKAQDLASSFIQKDKIEGYVTFSVDPIDFLLLSENNENWSSCHRLDGDYRAGNLNYVCDKTTFIAYISSGEKQHIKCLPPDIAANSKKWRMLLHWDITKPILWFNKQYPFELIKARESMASGLIDIFEQYSGDILYPNLKYIDNCGVREIKVGEKTVTLDHNHIFYYDYLFDGEDLIQSPEYKNTFYNDLLYSSTYLPYVSSHYLGVVSKEELKDYLTIKIGETIPCLACGEGVIQHRDSFLCPKCLDKFNAYEDFFTSCSYCGRRLWEEKDIYYDIDNDICCKTCGY